MNSSKDFKKGDIVEYAYDGILLDIIIVIVTENMILVL